MTSDQVREVVVRASRRKATVRLRVGGGTELLGSIAWVGIDVCLLVPRGSVRPMQLLMRAIELAEVVPR